MSAEMIRPFNELIALVGLIAFARGGKRFRIWAVRGRRGRPRFRPGIETICLWMIYSAGISFVIVLGLQVVRRMGEL